MKRIRALAIIVDQNNSNNRDCLFWRRFQGKEYFVFPGGGVELGETFEQAAVREAFEETSLNVEVIKPLYQLTFTKNEGADSIENHFFLCRYLSGEPKLGPGNERLEMTETEQYIPMWKNISEVADLILLPMQVKEYFLEDIKNNFSDTPRLPLVINEK